MAVSMDRAWRRTRWVAAWSCGAAATAFSIALSAGCVKPTTPVPEELTAVSDELPITGRSRFAGLPGVGESFHIGSYEITGVDRDSQFSVAGSLPGFAHTDIWGGYSYLFREGNEERRAECAFQANKKVYGHGAPVAFRKAGGTLGCVCFGSESQSDLTLQLSYSRRLHDRQGQWLAGRGELRAGGRGFGLEAISAMGTPGKEWVVGEGVKDTKVAVPSTEPTGFLVHGDGLEAGLELLHPGRMWLARSLRSGERREVACLLGGLLLYRAAAERYRPEGEAWRDSRD